MNTNENDLDIRLSIAVKNISSINRNDRLKSIQTIRKLMDPDDTEEEDEPPVDRVIQFGIIPILINYLKDSNDKEIQYECAWTIYSITAVGTHEQCKFDSEIHLVAFDLLSIEFDNALLVGTLIKILGMNSISSTEIRDFILESGIIEMLEYTLSNHIDNPFTVKAIVWFIYSYSAHYQNPPALYMHTKPLLKTIETILLKYMNNNEHDGMIMNLLRSFSMIISKQESQEIKISIVKHGFTKIIVNIITGSNRNVKNILLGLDVIETMLLIEDKECHNIIIQNSNLIDTLLDIMNLNASNPVFTKNIYTIISRITFYQIHSQLLYANSIKQQEQEGIDYRPIIQKSIELKNEIISIILNSLNNYDPQFTYILNNNAVKFLESNIETVKLNDSLIQSYLDSINSILHHLSSLINKSSSTGGYQLFKLFDPLINLKNIINNNYC